MTETKELPMIDLDDARLSETAPAVPASRPAWAATDKQLGFIKTLVDGRVLSDTDEQLVERARDDYRQGRFDRRRASALIEILSALPRRAAAVVPLAPAVEAPEGMHRLDGVIYKVQRAVHASGNLYAKKLVVDHYGTTDGSYSGRFDYAPGAIRRLSAETRMTLAEAKEFGALYGTCVYCGRTLTNEESIAYGMGPVCGGRFEQ